MTGTERVGSAVRAALIDLAEYGFIMAPSAAFVRLIQTHAPRTVVTRLGNWWRIEGDPTQAA